MTFYYFGYGSNMLRNRLIINNPSAKFKTIAELKKYKLGFSGFTDFWHGSPATLIESEDSSVWGVVYEMSKEDEISLDRQESTYKPMYVSVESPTFGLLKCKCYQKLLEAGDESVPSLIYKKIMIQGAKEHGLPDWYVKKLENVRDNGYKGKVGVNLEVDL